MFPDPARPTVNDSKRHVRSSLMPLPSKQYISASALAAPVPARARSAG